MNKKLSMIGIIVGIAAFIIGIAMKVIKPFTVSAIGSSDGPTAVFLAGKIGSEISGVFLVIGIILLFCSVVMRKVGK